MAAPFNFDRYREETSTPTRRLPGFGSGSSRYGDAVLWGTLLIVVGVLVAVILQRKQWTRQKAKDRTDAWRAVHEICARHKLTNEEEGVLIQSLKEVEASAPDKLLVTESRFNATVAPEVSQRLGPKPCERIRCKLFYGGIAKEEKVEFGGTHELEPGHKLRIHFENIAGTHLCTVLNVSKRSFVVTLPLKEDRHISPKKGQAVDGYMEKGKTLFAFKTEAVESFMGGVFACRIKHTSKIEEVHQREDSRADIQTKIRFSHFSGANVETGQIDLSNLESQLTDLHPGELRDISTGGAAILTQAQRDFHVGDFLKFTIALLPDDPEITVLGQVVHVSPLPIQAGNGQRLHIQFLGLDEMAQGTITRAVHEHSNK